MLKSSILVAAMVLGCTFMVPHKAHAQTSSAQVSATCKDGSAFTGKSRKGACKGHGGVASWADEAPSTASAAPATPATPATEPAAAQVAATCKDGTAFTGKSRKGACKGHGGVASWAGEAPAATASGATTAPAAPATPATEPAAALVAATCKDGTAFTGKSRKGACKGHGGVASWAGEAAAPAPMASSPAPAASAPAPAASSAPAAQAAPMAAGGGAGQVWVNTATKVYHCPGDRYYGKTKEGQYMSESAAVAAGDRADHGKACK